MKDILEVCERVTSRKDVSGLYRRVTSNVQKIDHPYHYQFPFKEFLRIQKK